MSATSGRLRWSGPGRAVEKTIHRKKRLSGGNLWGTDSIGQKTSVQPPSRKEGMTEGVIVR
jgi:hypothetical protein